MVKLDTETQVKLLHSEQFYLYCAQVKKKKESENALNSFSQDVAQ